MAYVGGSLTSLFGEVAKHATADVAPRIARKGGDRMHELAAANTPVRTGNLRTAWYQTPVFEASYGGIGTGHRVEVKNDTDYAAYVESGTGLWGPKHAKYPILPKDPGGWLAWRGKDGEMHFAKKVMHPGSPGNHMLAIAAHVTEAELLSGALAQGILDEWAGAVEGAAHGAVAR